MFHHRHHLLLLIISAVISPVFSGDIVNHLPGYSGKLPFHLETGYVSVGDSEMFYYFVESEGNPKTDPLLLWLTGGPGCSSWNGLVYEIGPLEFDLDEYINEGDFPKLRSYPYSWTKDASIIFLDSPVGTGFSYSKTREGWPSSDTKAAKEAYGFLSQWMMEHPQYLNLRLFVGGDAYSGIIVPLLTKLIIQGKEGGKEPNLNLKGYIVGSPNTDLFIDENSKVQFAHRMALISDNMYRRAKKHCNENYINVDESNTDCVLALADYNKCVKYLWPNQILEPKCTYIARPQDERWTRRSLEENSDDGFILSTPQVSNLWCRNFNYVLSDTWVNNEAVQDALHIRKGTIKQWSRCNKTISYMKDQPSVVDIHRYLTNYDLNVLVDIGDRDMVVPFVAVVQWIKSLNLTISDEWRPWFVDAQVAGYTRTYGKKSASYSLTYATVKGGGHTTAEYYRQECYEMFSRWVNYYPL